MKSTIAKKTEGYGYKYTELADINKYCEENGIRYWQEVETCEINQKDYIVTYIEKEDKVEKHRGCQIVEAVLSGIKNPVQEYGSSLTYCRRYSLLMALGLATEDDDAQSLTQKKEITEEDAKKWTFTFGKHNGETMADVLESDEQYVEWYINNKANEYDIKCYELLTGVVMPSEEEKEERLKLMAQISKLSIEKSVLPEEIHEKFKVDDTADLTLEQMRKCVEALEKKEVE